MSKSYTINRLFITLACLAIILAGIKFATEIIVPFLLALFIAIICSPVINAMTARKIPQWLAITLLFVLILLLFFFLAGLINNTIREFTASIPQYKILLSQRVSDLATLAVKWHIPFSISKEQALENFDPSVLMNFVSKLLLSFSNVVTNVFVLLLVVVFMLLEAPTAKYKLARALTASSQDVQKQERYLDRILKGVIRYLGIKTLVGLMTAISVWGLLTLMGIQYALLWAILSFLLNYIPNIGSIIAAVPIIVQALLLNGFSSGFLVAIGVIMINMIIGNIIEPRMMGKTLGLSTLIIFLSLLFWGWLLGTVGMLLSVPLTMTLKIALESNPHTVRYAALLGDIEEDK